MKKLILVLLVSLFPTMAQAQSSVCISYVELAEKLTANYGEKVIGRNVTPKAMIERYVSEKGTWSYVLTRPNGKSCILAAGKDWQTITPVYNKPDDVES